MYRYQVISSGNIHGLEQLVTKALNDNWKCVGGVSLGREGSYCQAMELWEYQYEDHSNMFVIGRVCE